MRGSRVTVRTITIALTFIGIATDGYAQQPQAPVNIPLNLVPNNQSGELKLGINVGINGGDARPYVFDTGSPVFNAVYNENWWPGFTPDSATNHAPKSTVMSPDEGRLMNNAQFCLGGSNPTFCRGYTGNLVEVPQLDFFATTSDPTPAVRLSADPGYVVNAAYNYGSPDGSQNGLPFNENDPPVDTFFFGTFGAGNFLKNVPIVENPESPPGTPSNYYAGGVLGQTLVSGVTQGYVVAANGQKNPFSSVNGPQQIDGINVTVGGQTMQPVTGCNPCVTVGLTPEMQGQFWAATPTDGGNAGVIPWAVTSPEKFQNPYGGDPISNSSAEAGTIYKTKLTAPGGTKPIISEHALGLLDTGTPKLLLTAASLKKAEKISDGCSISTSDPTEFSCDVKAGTTLEIDGAAPDGKAIPGLSTTPMTLTQNEGPFENQPPDANSVTYNASLSNEKTSNTIGIPFFLQNSVMYDLDNRVIGYTPFFVTDAWHCQSKLD